MSTSGTPSVRDLLAEKVNIKIGLGTAGLDPANSEILVVEVREPSQVPEYVELGRVVSVYRSYRDGECVYRAQIYTDAASRERLALNAETPRLESLPAVSRVELARRQAEIDSRKSRRDPRRSW